MYIFFSKKHGYFVTKKIAGDFLPPKNAPRLFKILMRSAAVCPKFYPAASRWSKNSLTDPDWEPPAP